MNVKVTKMNVKKVFAAVLFLACFAMFATACSAAEDSVGQTTSIDEPVGEDRVLERWEALGYESIEAYRALRWYRVGFPDEELYRAFDWPLDSDLVDFATLMEWDAWSYQQWQSTAEEHRIVAELARLEREEEQAQREREDLAHRRSLYEADFRRNWTGPRNDAFERRLQHALTQWDLRNDDQFAAQVRAESVRRNQEQLEQERNAAAIAREIAGEVSEFWRDNDAPARHPDHVRWVRDTQSRIIGEVRTTGTYLFGR